MDYTLTLLRSEEIARDTMGLYFSKPINFEFIAGQSLDLTLHSPGKTDSNGDTRSCTIASAPYESHIMIAMRIRNTVFKHTLKSLKIGTDVNITGPYGSFTLHDIGDTPIVFLTGGIGVTPARSMVYQALHENKKNQITLIDSNHKEEDTPFINDLTKFSSKQENFIYIPTMTQADDSWAGSRERINETLLRSVIPDTNTPIYFTCGSMSMVYYLRQLLKSMGVAIENIRSEDFPGY